MADRKLAYASLTAPTLSPASLASSSSRTAGRQSAEVDNTTNKYLDHRHTRSVTTGTSPVTGSTIELWIIPIVDGSTYPDGFSTADANRSVTSRDMLFAYGRLAASVKTDNTSDRTYWLDIPSVAALFDGHLPEKYVLWLVHDTGVNLNATGGNHNGYARALYETT